MIDFGEGLSNPQHSAALVRLRPLLGLYTINKHRTTLATWMSGLRTKVRVLPPGPQAGTREIVSLGSGGEHPRMFPPRTL